MFQGPKHCFDYIILDEGHVIKNNETKRAKACHAICATGTRRLLLSGTPAMNDLCEFWSLANWATDGQVLGTLASFKKNYAKPICEGRNASASADAIKRGEIARKELKKLYDPYFLLRMNTVHLDQLPPRKDCAVWISMSKEQQRLLSSHLYDYTRPEHEQCVMKTKLRFLMMTELRKICGHPLLVTTSGRADLAQRLALSKVDELLEASNKLRLLYDAVLGLCRRGRKVLICSQFTSMLDIIERVLPVETTCRIDGAVSGRNRQKCVDEFNATNSSLNIMLLSTGVGSTRTGYVFLLLLCAGLC